MFWSQRVEFSNTTKLAVALQGKVDTICPSYGKDVEMSVSWFSGTKCESSEFEEDPGQLATFDINGPHKQASLPSAEYFTCPIYSKKHTISKSISRGTFYISKCFDVRDNKRFFLGDVYFWRNQKCHNYSSEPLLWSWVGTQRACKKLNSSLPEFINREQEAEFLRMLKCSKDIFPVEAVFIGLLQSRKCKVSIQSNTQVCGIMWRWNTKSTLLKLGHICSH